MKRILVDAGPLVAIIDESDGDHRRCVDELKRLVDPPLTTWTVITEAAYLLGQTTNPLESQDALLVALERRLIAIAELSREDIPRVRALIRKYRELPMDLADATLVRLAERERIRQVFTLDRRDFEIYRIGRQETFTIIP
ncbi:MAG TPA: PIN domain-containing protein [bacterium]|nr:PIN domain-containing protein [bacterium]